MTGTYVQANLSDATTQKLINFCAGLGIPNHLIEFHITILNTSKSFIPGEPKCYPIIIRPEQIRFENINQHQLGYIPMLSFKSRALAEHHVQLKKSAGGGLRFRGHISLAYGVPRMEYPKDVLIDFPLVVVGESYAPRMSAEEARASMKTIGV